MPPLKKRANATTAQVQVKEIVVPAADSPVNGVAEAVDTLTKLAKQKAESQPEVSVQSPKEPDPDRVPVPAGISPDEVRRLINEALAEDQAKRAQAEADAQAKAELEDLRRRNEELEKQLQETNAKVENLSSVTGLKGHASKESDFPNFNRYTSRTDFTDGLVKEAFELIQSAPRYAKNYEDQYFLQPDAEVIDGFVRNHIFEQKAKHGRPFVQVNEFRHLPLFRELESWAKRQGLFAGGSGPSEVKNAGVIGDDIVGGFLPVLSSLMRFTHRGGYIFWQFPDIRLDFGRNRGDTIQIPRYALAPEPANAADWVLSGKGTFANITDQDQNAQTGVVDAIINEYGMGKAGVNTNRPFMVPNFVQMYSMIDVLVIFDVHLARNYMQFEDRYIRDLWEPTSRIVYNNNDEVTTAPLDLGNGDDGTLTAEFLRSLYTYMRAAYIPTYRDGCYGLAVNSYALQQLRRSMAPIDASGFVAPNSVAELTELVNLLPALDDIDRVSGYVGKWANFHIFEQNTYGMGAAGTPGAQNVTTSATVASQLTRSCFAFGANTIGRGIGMPMEIRSQSGEILWNRAQRFIWISHESFTALDVDPTGYNDTDAVPQQLRVIEVRHLDRPI